jgi:hypothetical protein
MDCKWAEQIGQTNGDIHSLHIKVLKPAAKTESTEACRHVRCNAVPVPKLAASVAATQQNVIWLFWAQGWNEAPTIALICADSWERHNPGWVVRRLSLANLSAFDARPEEGGYDFLPPTTSPHYADLVRMELLRKHGGLWVDATVLCVKPIEHWLALPNVSRACFFAVRKSTFDSFGSVSNWMLYSASSGCLVLEMMSSALRTFWRRPHQISPANTRDSCYFIWHKLFECLWRTSNPFKHAVDQMPHLPGGDLVPSTLTPVQNSLFRTPLTSQLKATLHAGPFFKLSHKQAGSLENGSILAYIFSSM